MKSWHKSGFRKHFGRELSEFWAGRLLGFDIIKFEEELFPHIPFGWSLADTIRHDKGVDAANLVRELCTLY